MLFRHFEPRATGKTIIINNGVCTETTYPYQEDLENADYYFLGGHRYVVSSAVATILQNCGYTTTAETADISGTWAMLETGVWDDWDGYQWGDTP